MPKSTLKLLSLACTLALVAGCATITPDYLDHSLARQSSGTHPVTVAISNVMLPGHARPYVRVDGKAAATLGGGQAVTMYLPDGRHRIDIGPHADGPNSDASINVLVSELSPPIVRAQYKENGHHGWTLSTTRDTAAMPENRAPGNRVNNAGMTDGS